MELLKLKESLEKRGLRLTDSEMTELNGERNEWYEELRAKGYYRVYETYYKDEYDCHQFYATGFMNSEEGHLYLIAGNEENEDLVDLYLVLNGDTQRNRKQRLIATGTEEEILEISKQKDKVNYKSAKENNFSKVF